MLPEMNPRTEYLFSASTGCPAGCPASPSLLRFSPRYRVPRVCLEGAAALRGGMEPLKAEANALYVAQKYPEAAAK